MIFFENLLTLENSELGKKTKYDDTYNPERLFPIYRGKKRIEIGIDPHRLPFYGFDQWNHYEVSWLNKKGKPVVALAEIKFNANSPCLIESKSMKIYFNSLNNSLFESIGDITKTVKMDLENKTQSQVEITIVPIKEFNETFQSMEGVCLDYQDIDCNKYTVDPSLLILENETGYETVYSNLLRSNCLMTGQPDWATVQISYQGSRINHKSLLRYIVSYRNHSEFGEQCVERMFMDILKHCKPIKLTMICCYTRRGGININCYRSTHELNNSIMKGRLIRQ